MNKRLILRWSVPLFLLAALAVLVLRVILPGTQQQVQAQMIGFEPEPFRSAFERVTGPRDLIFPLDQGPHPDFQTEWWYYTGNLQDDQGQRFGYQLTFFRRALQPAGDRSNRSSTWAVEQVYMAHFALTDVSEGAFYTFERFERGAAGLAGAQGSPLYQVWLRDWQVEQTGADRYHLYAADGPVVLDLEMLDRKGTAMQGDRGYSQKGSEPGNASLYFSQTRLETNGTVTVGERSHAVSGLSWLDREISTSVLGKDQVGWDWFALQLDDGSELMAYTLRRADGTLDAFSSGTLIQPDGETVHLTIEDFQVTSQTTWRSPHSGGVYPASWSISVPGDDLLLQVEPLLADQELNLSFIYWEGAVQVIGTRNDRPISGFGYVELTGYADSLEDDL